MRNITFILVFCICSIGCNQTERDGNAIRSGNDVKDYFIRKGYNFPFHCDSIKPICKAEDSSKVLGQYNRKRKLLVLQACNIISRKFNKDSLIKEGIEAFTVFPVFVYNIDPEVLWYRVVYREYKNNKLKEENPTGNWQLIDSNRVMATYHNLEFQINEGDSLEFMCDRM